MKLGLGSAQFGMDYGATNQTGRLSHQNILKILSFAKNNGIDLIDTAQAYGTAEESLGKALPGESAFRIVTKTKQFNKKSVDQTDAQKIIDVYCTSLSKLNFRKTYGLLVHSAQDLLVDGGEYIFDALLQLKREGKVEKVGVSVYHGHEIDDLLDRYSFDIMQVPINVLDQRLLKSAHLAKLNKLGIEIHARSLFLQGTLLSEPLSLPKHLSFLCPHVEDFNQLIQKSGLTPLAACLDFAKKIPELDYGIVGVASLREFEEIFAKFSSSREATKIDYSTLAVVVEDKIDPSKWPKKRD
jgi:aryl-alcohol dehydrogenase-like predicted oxidoreductase